MPYFKLRGKSCYYEEHGDGTPILFLHGNTASSNMFMGIKDLFTNSFKAITLDFLGHGKSDRLENFCTDLWYDEALQAIEFIEHMRYGKVHLIGSSGGALVAINISLERPDLVGKVIADSFEGEQPLREFTQNVIADREASKQEEGAKSFYCAMHGEDWESVVDNDTYAIHEHAKSIGKFFHKPIETLNANILLTGSQEDEFISFIDPNYFTRVYTEMIEKIGHGGIHIFKQGGHPAIMSNSEEFRKVAEAFFQDNDCRKFNC
ncbi:AB hydrolase superfamily protein YdjP [Anaerotignum neopropionicum]|uniref:AB hydrolase superfamily protein YdjP n=1 Tax=Anaerotignum neopropionicum TaxID=36847 RepID=A0A136WEA6_9FIRM|nr:alpha/beta hydrolase [Anaerotignum neopropionicum]KXL52840.1 AB hydrolase superfamily protein YdjP [Anaerotignum neopropionicum]